MSDPYLSEAPEEAGFDPANFLANEQRRATAAAITSLDDDPDKAARAQELADATGTHPALVYGDLDNFEAQHKAALTAQLLNNNAYLRDYVNSHPLAAKVSNDDFGQLDAASQAIEKTRLSVPGGGDYSMGPASVVQKVVEGFKDNFDYDSTVAERQKFADLLENTFSSNIPFLQQGADALLLSQRIFSGIVGGSAAGAGELYKQLGGSEAWGDRLTRDLIVMAQVALSDQAGLHGIVAPELHAEFAKAVEAGRAAEPYLKTGTVPPVGIHPIIDELHTQQAKLDADNLAEALKESVKSTTRERSPDLYANFVRQITDGDIGIKADAVRALYGEKPPVDGEGPLGFVQGLNDKLVAAEVTGGDVQVPIADWLAKIEPDVAKELQDHIRARTEGLTVEEGKELEAPEGQPVGPVEAVRQAAGFTPTEGKLTLERGADVGKTHVFAMKDATGNELGEVYVAEENGGKRLYIDDVRSKGGMGSIGPSAIRDATRQLFEQFPEAEEIKGLRVSGAREAGEKFSDMVVKRPAKPKQLELPQAGTTRIEDREAFAKASAIGMTVEQYKRYNALIEKRAVEDAKAAESRAMADQRKRQTAEWKANRAELRPQVKDQITARPDVELDGMLASGKVRFAKDGLTPEQASRLPKEYISADGIHPDDLSGLFGDSDGRVLVDRVGALAEARAASGMKPRAFLERMIDAETDRQMELKYGSLDRNILEEAKDQVLSETQEDLLHEETLARASEAGLEFSIGKEELKAAIKGFFDRQLVRDVSSDKALAEAGRAGRAAEMALLKGDYAEAFRQKQRQFNAFTMATFAKRFEKEQVRFEKLAKRFSAREVANVDQEYTNWIHDILGRTGNPVKRSVQDLQEALARGEQKTLEDFVDFKQNHDMREVPVAEFLFDTAFRKQMKDLTTVEAQAVHDSIRALAKNGRDERSIIKAGEEFDLAEKKSEMITQLATFKELHYDATGGRGLGPLPAGLARPLRTYLVSHLQLESIFNRWDRGDPNGVFTQFIARELASAANGEAALEREFSVKLRALADKADLKARVPNELFRDPLGDQPITMTRKNLRAVLLNVGNKSNFDKLARGYLGDIAKGEEGKAQVAAFQSQVMDWLRANATKEDWDWAQGIGNIFKEIKARSDTMYQSLTGGVEPENIPLQTIDTPHGQYDGWYYPAIYHQVWEGSSKKLMGGDALEQNNYIRATTPAGYTKQRTGYAAPLALDLDMMPVRMRQMIHDIAFRPSVIQAGKIFYDKDVRAAITKHYGTEYTKMLVPYLRDVANAANYRNDAQQVFTRVSEFIRQNIITTLIGLNPGTVLKHGPTAAMNSISEVGASNFLRAAKGLFSINEETGESNWAFAMKTSEELQRRQRFYRETLGGATEEIQGERSLRDTIINLGATPVAMSDLLSATPTWMAKYQAEMEDHGVHGDAVFAADRAVRRAHGSSVITNRPQVMRTGAMGSWLASLYGFFNHIMNRQYELTWKAGDALDLVKQGEYDKAMAEVPKLSGMLFSYVIFPAVVEELVTPMTTNDKESWGMKAAKSLAYTISASWIGVRDIVSAAVNGRDPSIGLLTTAYKTVTDTVRDLEKDRAFSKRNAGQLIQHAATTLGAATGMMNAQVGKAARFIYDYATGQEKPKGPWGWLTGLRYGTLKNHPATFEKYMKGK